MFLDEAALRVSPAFAQLGYKADGIAVLSYQCAEAMWIEREKRRATVPEEPQQATTRTGPDL